MKVIIISPNSSFGGAATANLNIAHMMHVAGVDITYNDEFAKELLNMPFNISVFPFYGNRKNKQAFIKYVEDEKYDYVLLGDNRLAIHYFVQLLALKRKGVRIGIIFHSLNIGNSFRDKITDWLVSVVTLCANDLIYVSKYTQRSWNRFFIPRICNKKGVVIYNAVHSIRHTERMYHNKPNIVFVGRFSLEKRPELFCKIAENFSDKYLFTMWGDGPLYNELFEKYSNFVVFKGYCSDINMIYDNATLIVVPSVFENCPMCILESMVRGIPSICTNVGGISEIVTPGYNGEYLNVDDYIVSFEKNVNSILKNYSDYQANCYKKAQSFTIENQSKIWKSFIERNL